MVLKLRAGWPIARTMTETCATTIEEAVIAACEARARKLAALERARSSGALTIDPSAIARAIIRRGTRVPKKVETVDRVR